MVAYGAGVGFYLAYAGLEGGFAGILLWPAVVLHVLLKLLMVGKLVKGPR